MKVAIIHYWLVGMRGGEKVVEQFCELFPDADIFTHAYDPGSITPTISKHRVVTSFISKLPGGARHFRRYLPLMPRALEALDLSSYDLVISSESGPAKAVITAPDALHVCYVHSPMRYLWDQKKVYSDDASVLERLALAFMGHKLRIWDTASACRPDVLIANSDFVRKRIRKCWGREASVICPPVQVGFFADSADHQTAHMPENNEAPYLFVGELVGYKQPALAIQACNKLNRPLIVVGDGPLRKKLEMQAGPSVTFRGRVSNEDLLNLYKNCKALLYPGVEDFGITPLEVAAAGRPTIALNKGGACETVVHKSTGFLYEDSTIDGLIAAIQEFEQSNWFRPSEAIRQAGAFSPDIFKKSFLEILMGSAPSGLSCDLKKVADNLTSPQSG